MTNLRAPVASEGVALLAGAAAIAQGTLEKNPANGHLRVTLDIYDAASHKLLHSASAEDADPFAAASRIAKALDSKATPLGNRESATLGLWTEVLNATDAPQLVEGCRKLLDAEPSFSAAYGSCGTVLLQTAIPMLERRAIAEKAYATRNTLKPDALGIAGQLLFQTGRFQQASEVLTRAAATVPAAWNQVGYSQAMLGNIAAAKKALEDYRKFGGDEPNAVDSLGEIHYITGNYPEAENYFLECANRFPQTVQGRVANLKAAAVRALRGNKAGAEELARSMIDGLKKAGQDTRGLEELWRGVILEQDPQALKKRIENGIIAVPARE